MKTLSYKILRLFGWQLVGNYPDLKKSIIVIAPHTSNWDFVLGKLYMNVIGVKNKVLVKKELFFFPLNIILKLIGSIPIDRHDKKNSIISQTVNLFNTKKEFCLVIAPEGTRKREEHWKKGYLFIANKAQVPVIISYIDYKLKELGIKEIIWNVDDIKASMRKITEVYKNVNAKHPENFSLDKRFE